MEYSFIEVIKSLILIFIAYILLFAITKWCWLAIRYNTDPKDLGCLVHTHTFHFGFCYWHNCVTFPAIDTKTDEYKTHIKTLNFMSQNKKPPTPHQTQKIVAAQYRKEFFRKMKFIIDSICGKDIFPLIPLFVLNDAYLCRCTPFKFKSDYNSEIPKNIYTDSKVVLSHIFKNHSLYLPPHELEIKLSDYFSVVLTIIILDSRITEHSFDNAHKVKAALQSIIADAKTNENTHKELYTALNSFSLGISDLQNVLYWYTYEFINPKSLPAEFENIIKIHSIKAETISVEIEGSSRPALRVGWTFAYTGPEWINIKPVDLGFKSPFAEISFKVYIQAHALNRLKERIDCFETGMIHYNMYGSLMTPKFAYDTNKNLLIEFSFFNTKAGYFRAEIVDGIILLRTFLFITNNGTPEGQLLANNTGLQKLDKKFLTIDKLSTFMNSDLDKNEEAQQLLKSCGCQCLIDLFNNMKPLLIKKDNNFKFDMMLNYLNANKIN